MARRASSTTNPVWFIAVAALIALAILVGWWLKNRVSGPFRTLPAFPVAEYLQNADSLRGNTYKIEGVIGQQLHYDPAGRLFEVLVGSDPIPVQVPSKFNELDIRKEGKFQFKVTVGDKGILRAEDVRKD